MVNDYPGNPQQFFFVIVGRSMGGYYFMGFGP